MTLEPKFDLEGFINGVGSIAVNKATAHSEILDKMFEQVVPIDFKERAGIAEQERKVAKHHLIVISIEQILSIATVNKWGLCKHNHFIYLYNGAFWSLLERDELESFLSRAAEKMGIDQFQSKYYPFKEQLLKQFLSVAHLPKLNQSAREVKINLGNGTYVIHADRQELRGPDKEDFITYQLPYDFVPSATAPMFTKFLNEVLPETESQMILAEYLGYLFIKSGVLKLEKSLLLYGYGANGKSVFFEIVNALLGGEKNVSNYSLQSLTNENGYFRAMLANKLVNYGTEINGKLETSIFKQLVSGEPVEARLPYGDPHTITNYAKLIFNCNELPKEVEHTNAYFRRFLIIPFSVTIAEEAQDKELAKKIISQELSGVFNWVLAGLKRLLKQKKFTYSRVVQEQIESYKKSSDTIQVFIEDENYRKSTDAYLSLDTFFTEYKLYCSNSGYKFYGKKNFAERLRSIGFMIVRKSEGNVVYIKKEVFFQSAYTTPTT
jgi:putative DNA primase/helicase